MLSAPYKYFNIFMSPSICIALAVEAYSFTLMRDLLNGNRA